MTITQLRASGFIDDIYEDKVTMSTTQEAIEITSPASPMNNKSNSKKKKKDDATNLKRAGIEGVSFSSQQMIESGKLVKKKRKEISRIEVSSKSNSESCTTGHIINSENRFYQEKNKSKRKKLRS
jgi:hypothetical protein